ncbi:hypothetical protein [Ilumatobacter coccineus]|uniref:hypothetical protein n=1 Tax=Ilumatobacter coccineus TaxID=467094 RepID=UPI001E3FC120|nr:hypothetical protein [Ilumatobacter coccineus]
MTIDSVERAMFGDRNRRSHLRVEATALRLEFTNLRIQTRIIQLQELRDPVVEHDFILLEHMFDHKFYSLDSMSFSPGTGAVVRVSHDSGF